MSDICIKLRDAPVTMWLYKKEKDLKRLMLC